MKEQLAILQDSEKGHTEALQLLQRQLTETKVQLFQTSGSRAALIAWCGVLESFCVSSFHEPAVFPSVSPGLGEAEPKLRIGC